MNHLPFYKFIEYMSSQGVADFVYVGLKKTKKTKHLIMIANEDHKTVTVGR